MLLFALSSSSTDHVSRAAAAAAAHLNLLAAAIVNKSHLHSNKQQKPMHNSLIASYYSFTSIAFTYFISIAFYLFYSDSFIRRTLS